MGHFKYQHPIPTLTRSHTYLRKPTHHLSNFQPETRVPLTAQGRWPLACTEGQPSSWGAGSHKLQGQGQGWGWAGGVAESGRRAGLGGELHLQTKGGRAPAGWVGPG